MGYFSNGSEGEDYRERYCDRCVHDGHGENSCPVWELHEEHNYDQCDDPKLAAFLGALIPRRPDGFNGRCRLFLPEGG